MDIERYENWKEIWKKLKRHVKEGTKDRRKRDLVHIHTCIYLQQARMAMVF